MIKSAQYHRLLWMTLLVVIAFFGLGWRLIDLQYLRSGESWKAYEKASVVDSVIMPWRGEITDRHGTALAMSVRHYNIGVDPSYIAPFHLEVAEAIGPVLEIPVAELAAKIEPRKVVNTDAGTTNDLQFVPVANGVSHAKLEAMREALKQIGQDINEFDLTWEERQRLRNVRRRGAYVSREVQMRQYPNGSMAAPVLGLVNDKYIRDDQPGSPSYFIQLGANGIESALNAQLAGTPGRVRKVRTELLDEITDRFDARDGMNVALTIDRRIQEFMDQVIGNALIALDAKRVFGIVMDVNTFEVLAVSSAPTFDPRDRSTFKPEHAKVLSFTEGFEPGSTIKAIAIAGALNENAVTLDDVFFCENGIWLGEPSRGLKDVKSYGNLTVKEIVTKSSNIGTSKIAQHMGYSRFYEYCVKFGVGKRTGIGLYEEPGVLHSREYYKPMDISRLPVGYVSRMTQLQIACLYSAIGNGGLMMRPQILRRIEDRDGTAHFQFEPQVLRRVITERSSRNTLEALQTVTETGGTATTAALTNYTVAGKTGTAHKYTGNPDAPYDNQRYYGSFAGVFPASNPRICIVITVDEPNKATAGHYGGKVAGPIFAEIGEMVGQHLNITPDKSPTTVALDSGEDEE